MPGSKYIKVHVAGQQLDLTDPETLPISISYKREDKDSFQTKRSSEAFDVNVPATVTNDQIANTFHNPGIDDMSPNESFRSFRNALIEANGYELLIGKALLTGAAHTDKPEDYDYDFYGNNADWLIPLKEVTMFDLSKHITFTFDKAQVIASWAFDGTDENLPYVFAPVRYGQQLEKRSNGDLDANMIPGYFKPSLSVYWFIYWGLKSIGYRIDSTFMNTEYFRRLVMPWTWGNFLFSDGTRLENLGFLAKSTTGEPDVLWNVTHHGYFMVNIGNDFSDGGYDNNGVYSADPGVMIWEYKAPFDYGPLDATFHFQPELDITCTANSYCHLYLEWYVNGVLDPAGREYLIAVDAPTIGRRDFQGILDVWKTLRVAPGDIVELKIWVDMKDTGFGRANVSIFVLEYKLDYFRIPLGGTIDFEGYNGLKKYKFLDFLAGILDCFNISPGTDPVNKVVTLEPDHDYSLTDDLSQRADGYYTGNYIDWNEKQDVSKKSKLTLWSDSERELIFSYKDDANDGMLKKIQDRNITKINVGKYVFPDRFKAGQKTFENRFFAPVVHCELKQWTHIDDYPVDFGPQVVTLIPENISNTSKEEAQNTFTPKLCYYKGIRPDTPWIFDDEAVTDWPFMFAVNYNAGGENDPILSYCDEWLGPEGTEVIGKGLQRRFFLQRMAIQRNGQYYDTFFKFNNLDVMNRLFREFIGLRGQKWEMLEIKDFKPLLEEATGVLLRKWSPIAQRDNDAMYPSNDSVSNVAVLADPFDIKYARAKCLSSDIPVIQPFP